ncbi:uncharacterized protein LOC126899737 [Daktulosphaira vitifoliae]|uniref:uncharacterized protein LOC126899737 n=1 Tax=Daktulosphaira vitifoliae TaxID=58002 RepID=UPI0021AB035F|nr:uncharacterized protein LOC126899737 [Daktulosphaira vitifoliae]
MIPTHNLTKLLLVIGVLFILACSVSSRSSNPNKDSRPVKEPSSSELDSLPENENQEESLNDLQLGSQSGLKRRPNRCPLCDSSVYSYCSDKLLHDACCCLDPQDLPNECQFADCSFLHSNTCKEHRLITACCCNQFTAHKK